jgi:hypothetical protein
MLTTHIIGKEEYSQILKGHFQENKTHAFDGRDRRGIKPKSFKSARTCVLIAHLKILATIEITYCYTTNRFRHHTHSIPFHKNASCNIDFILLS